MKGLLRRTGIDVVGDARWGTHWCQFYNCKQDLIDVLVPYFRQGLADNEFCMWITYAPLSVPEAQEALKAADPRFERFLRSGQIEILDGAHWYTPNDHFEAEELSRKGAKKLQQALDRGYEGMRVAGGARCVAQQDWAEITAYEELVNRGIGKYPVLAICTYCLNDCGAAEIMDIMSNHRFSLIKRNGSWQIIESSEHQKAETALRESERRLRLACSAARLGVFEWNVRDDTVRAENECMAAVCGGTVSLGFAEFCSIVIDSQDLLAFENALSKARREDAPFHIVCRSRNGTCEHEGWFEFSGRFYFADDGSAERLVGIVADVTERKLSEKSLKRLNDLLEHRVRERTAELALKNKELQRRAEQLSRLASELTLTEKRERNNLAKVLHDNLQQVLAAATVRLQAATDSAGESEHIDTICDAQNLIRQSINMCRSLTIELSPTILHEAGLVAGLEWLARSMHSKYGLAVDLQSDKDVDPNRQDIRILLFESVRELLFNVVKHAGVHHAQVILSRSKEALKIVVSDAGSGFDSDQIGRCEKTGGFGLFSIRERLELLGGSMAIQSAPQQGAVFTLVAPVNDSSKAVTPAVEHTPPSIIKKAANTHVAGTLSILLVDDHSIFRQAMAARLNREQDIEILGEAGNGVEAIEKARELQPDVILMDFSMPQMDGVEATRRIHAEMPSIRIVGLSMYQEADRAKSMLDAGASDYVTKTAQLDQLLNAIRSSP